MAPLISVVIPAYNCEQFIADALDSVIEQNILDLEIFVIDDGSTDCTKDVVSRYGDSVTLIQQQNAGAAVARNEGLRRARGKYVALLDSDDLWLPGKLQLQIDHLERHPDVDMCCTRWGLLYPDTSGQYSFKTPSKPESSTVDPMCAGWIYCKLLQDCIVWTSTVVMRRTLIEHVGSFDPELRRGQDYDYWVRASRKTKIDRLDVPLALYRMQVSHDRKFPDKNWELAVIQRAIENWGATGPDGCTLSDAELRTRLWALNYQFGYDQYHNGRYSHARVAFAAALRERPAHMKTILYFLASNLKNMIL